MLCLPAIAKHEREGISQGTRLTNNSCAHYSSTLWPRPGLQGRSSVGVGSKILQQQQLIPGKSRQGRPTFQL